MRGIQSALQMCFMLLTFAKYVNSSDMNWGLLFGIRWSGNQYPTNKACSASYGLLSGWGGQLNYLSYLLCKPLPEQDILIVVDMSMTMRNVLLRKGLAKLVYCLPWTGRPNSQVERCWFGHCLLLLIWKAVLNQIFFYLLIEATPPNTASCSDLHSHYFWMVNPWRDLRIRDGRLLGMMIQISTLNIQFVQLFHLLGGNTCIVWTPYSGPAPAKNRRYSQEKLISHYGCSHWFLTPTLCRALLYYTCSMFASSWPFFKRPWLEYWYWHSKLTA